MLILVDSISTKVAVKQKIIFFLNTRTRLVLSFLVVFLDVEWMIPVCLLTQVTNIKELINLMYFTFTMHINIKHNLHARIHLAHT